MLREGSYRPPTADATRLSSRLGRIRVCLFHDKKTALARWSTETGYSVRFLFDFTGMRLNGGGVQGEVPYDDGRHGNLLIP